MVHLFSNNYIAYIHAWEKLFFFPYWSNCYTVNDILVKSPFPFCLLWWYAYTKWSYHDLCLYPTCILTTQVVILLSLSLFCPSVRNMCNKYALLFCSPLPLNVHSYCPLHFFFLRYYLTNIIEYPWRRNTIIVISSFLCHSLSKFWVISRRINRYRTVFIHNF